MAEGVQSGPEQSRARSLRRQRTLDGEDRSVTIRQEGKGQSLAIFALACVLPPRPNQPCRHPSIRTLDERFLVSLGASWVFSFQPVLPPDFRPLFPSRDRSWARPLTQSPELGAGARCFHSMNLKLCGCRQWHRSAVAQRFVSFSTHPQAMQQHGQLSRRRNHRSFLPILSATLRQLRPQRRRSLSAPNGPRMWCAPCTNNVRKYGSPSLLMCSCGSLCPELRRPGCNPT